MGEYPLILTMVHDLKFDDGAVRVATKARALMVFEEEQWWCHGVEPGGMTAPGDTPVAAFVSFKSEFGGILSDMAASADSFESLRTLVTDFVRKTDGAELLRWESARNAIRSGSKVDEQFDKMKRITAEVSASVFVQMLSVIVGKDGDDVELAVEELAA